MKTVTDRLEGMSFVIGWVITATKVVQTCVNDFFAISWELSRRLFAALTPKVFLLGKVLVVWPTSFTNRALTRRPYAGQFLKELPAPCRWIIGAMFVWPIYAIRYALIVVLIVLWVCNAPRVARFTLNNIARVESLNKKRTPKKSRPWQRLDDFDDVRVRVSELTQWPKQ